MPGGAGRAVCSCPMCKPYKFSGNCESKWVGRRPAKEMARAPGTTKRARELEARRALVKDY